MRAAVLHEQHTPIRVEDLDLDGPGPGEVRVKVVGGGICHSDYHRVDGHSATDAFPIVMGHEGSGRGPGGWARCNGPDARGPRHLLPHAAVRPLPLLLLGPSKPV